MKKTADSLLDLVAVIRKLRGPNGCPWDKSQTPADVKIYLIEELYEVLEAIDTDDASHLAEEIGDLLFMLLFLVNLYEEKSSFTLHEVLNKVRAKMVHRHPHVFGSVQASSTEQVKANWQILKQQEGKKPKSSLLDDIPPHLPALSEAFFLTAKAAKVGFDWKQTGDVIKKIREELAEVEHAVTAQQLHHIRNELGDLLFSMVNLCRHLGIEPEQALRGTNKKFVRRFAHIEAELKKKGVSLHEASLEDMDRLWEEAKRME
ncbi:MAG: nucleoside triphosphate pyrophosphohydrolase [Desulfobacterota bacterium]|nr:nucleoside triphosphate pyrophosphohydrolase [Thermodesulfobacteriota bacterium]